MMKIAKKVTRVRLEARQTDEFILRGLVSAEPDYKLSLLLNRQLRISLKNTDPLVIDSSAVFSRFSSIQTNTDITYTLVSNRNEGKSNLLKKFRNLDYILIVHDPENMVRQEDLTLKLRSIESITAVFGIDPHSIKDKNLGYIIH